MVLYIKKVKVCSLLGPGSKLRHRMFRRDILLCLLRIGIRTVFDVICMCHYSGAILSTEYKLHRCTEYIYCSSASAFHIICVVVPRHKGLAVNSD